MPLGSFFAAASSATVSVIACTRPGRLAEISLQAAASCSFFSPAAPAAAAIRVRQRPGAAFRASV